MRSPASLSSIVAAACVALGSVGCNTLGITLYPSGERLTNEAERVLDNSRIPIGVPRENEKTVLPSHALEPGDVVLIEPVDFERDLRLPGDQAVLADGTLDLGAYGRVVVAGRTLEQAESLIENQIARQLLRQERSCHLAADAEPLDDHGTSLPADCDGVAINVQLVEPIHRFYVLGEVNAPGAYALTGSETVLDAIVDAGGLTDSADPCDILLARPTGPRDCRVTMPVCYREIVQMGATTTNYQLQPGDRIFVSARSCFDELLFWRASCSCPRCSGCNRACRNPPVSTAVPMPFVEPAAIPPGSSGRTDLAEELLYSDPRAATRSFGPRAQRNTAGVPDDEPLPSKPSVSPTGESELDGELDFAPFDDR